MDVKVAILYSTIEDKENKLAELSGRLRQLLGDNFAAKHQDFTLHIALCNHLKPSYHSAADAEASYHFGRLCSLEVNYVDLCNSSAFNYTQLYRWMSRIEVD